MGQYDDGKKNVEEWNIIRYKKEKVIQTVNKRQGIPSSLFGYPVYRNWSFVPVEVAVYDPVTVSRDSNIPGMYVNFEL